MSRPITNRMMRSAFPIFFSIVAPQRLVNLILQIPLKRFFLLIPFLLNDRGHPILKSPKTIFSRSKIIFPSASKSTLLSGGLLTVEESRILSLSLCDMLMNGCQASFIQIPGFELFLQPHAASQPSPFLVVYHHNQTRQQLTPRSIKTRVFASSFFPLFLLFRGSRWVLYKTVSHHLGINGKPGLTICRFRFIQGNVLNINNSVKIGH